VSDLSENELGGDESRDAAEPENIQEVESAEDDSEDSENSENSENSEDSEDSEDSDSDEDTGEIYEEATLRPNITGIDRR
jgi:hypothetical protein